MSINQGTVSVSSSRLGQRAYRLNGEYSLYSLLALTLLDPSFTFLQPDQRNYAFRSASSYAGKMQHIAMRYLEAIEFSILVGGHPEGTIGGYEWARNGWGRNLGT